MSWAADGRQYVGQCDGSGFLEPHNTYYNSHMYAIEGGPRALTFHDLPGYPLLTPSGNEACYYGFGTLALDGAIYHFMSTFNAPTATAIAEVKRQAHQAQDPSPLRFIGAKLIYSPDSGRHWCNQDGTTPVVWEDWKHRSRETMLFFQEDQEAFSLLSVLQMGRNYEHNRDGYVYVYAPNGNTEGTMNELVMFRVHKTAILKRDAYEYFSGIRPNGDATWDKDIEARRPVHTFPSGWVNRLWHPWAWIPSVVYYAPLNAYMMATFATGKGTNVDGLLGLELSNTFFAKPSYLGFWLAPTPWGPWRQIHEETSWTPAGDRNARAYMPQIAPKWIAPDGKSFWLVWSDFQITGDKQELAQYFAGAGARTPWQVVQARFMPNYAFNVQRVDLTLV